MNPLSKYKRRNRQICGKYQVISVLEWLGTNFKEFSKKRDTTVGSYYDHLNYINKVPLQCSPTLRYCTVVSKVSKASIPKVDLELVEYPNLVSSDFQQFPKVKIHLPRKIISLDNDTMLVNMSTMAQRHQLFHYFPLLLLLIF